MKTMFLVKSWADKASKCTTKRGKTYLSDFIYSISYLPEKMFDNLDGAIDYYCTIDICIDDRVDCVYAYSKQLLKIEVPDEVNTFYDLDGLGQNSNTILDKGKPVLEEINEINSLY